MYRHADEARDITFDGDELKPSHRSMLRIDPALASQSQPRGDGKSPQPLSDKRTLGASGRIDALRQSTGPAALPPTPMTAYFDAEDMAQSYDVEEDEEGFPGSNDVDEGSLSAAASSPPTSTGTTAQPTFATPMHQQEQNVEQHPQRARGLHALQGESIKYSVYKSEHGTDTFKQSFENEQDGVEYEGSIGNQSLSSEAESPGPVTPATPGSWRPRELTLLRPRLGSEAESSAIDGTSGAVRGLARSRGTTSGNGETDRGRAATALLDGLGIRGLSSATNASANAAQSILLASPRPLARGGDVFPIASKMHHQRHGSPSSSIHSSAIDGPDKDYSTGAVASASRGPRELKLASSTGPPSVARMLPPYGSPSLHGGTALTASKSAEPQLSSSSSSSSSHPSPSNSNARKAFSAQKALSAPSTCRLPVRHGPAFSPHSSSSQDSSLPLMPSNNKKGQDSLDEAQTHIVLGPDHVVNARLSPSLGVRATGVNDNVAGNDDKDVLTPSSHHDRLPHASFTVSSSSTMSSQSLDNNNSSSGAHVQGSFSDSLASGTRKKGPPAPLHLFAASPPSSYSNSSADLSRPNSALSVVQRSPVSTQPWTEGLDPGKDVCEGSQSGQLSVGSPPVLESAAFNVTKNKCATPLQSPLQVVREEDTECDVSSKEGLISLPTASQSNATSEASTKRGDLGLVGLKHVNTETSQNQGEGEQIEQRQTPSAGSVTNAFEFETYSDATKADSDAQGISQSGIESVVVSLEGKDATEEEAAASEEASIQRDSSSLGSVSHRPPSPAPRLSFNTSIFAPPTDSVVNDTEQHDIRSMPSSPPRGAGQLYASEPDHVQYTTASAVPSPSRQHFTVSQQCSEERPDTTLNAEASTATKTLTGTNQSRESVPSLHRTSASATSSNYAHHLDTQDRRESRSRMKATLVPDVPSFGYMGRMTSSSASPSSQTPFMETRDHAKFFPYPYSAATVREDEPQGTSRWSSGSEDEDDRASLSSKSARKTNISRSRKNSHSTVTSSAASSRRNTGISSSASLVPLKKSSLFSGLGLRKKSIAALASEASSQASASPMASTSDSPVMGRAEGMKEFPFPMLGHKSAKASMSSSPFSSPSVTMRIERNDSNESSSVRGSSAGASLSASRLQFQPSSPSLNERTSSSSSSTNLPTARQGHIHVHAHHPAAPAQQYRLLPRPSDASISTSVSSLHCSERATSSASTESSGASPVLERAPQVPWTGALTSEVPAPLKGLGILVGSNGFVSDDATGEKTMQDRIGRQHLSIKSFRSTDSLSGLRNGTQSTTSLRRYEHQKGSGNVDMLQARQQTNDNRLVRDSIRQRALTLSDMDSGLSKVSRESASRATQRRQSPLWSPPHSGLLPSMPFSTSPERAAEERQAPAYASVSPDETPRIAYAALSASSSPAHDSDQHMYSPVASHRRTNDDEGLFAMGQAFAYGLSSSSSSPPLSSLLQHHHHQRHHDQSHPGRRTTAHRRVRYVAPRVRPRYPSLTDNGRAWQAAHPDQPFYAALGPAFLEIAIQDHSSAGGSAEKPTTASSNQSDSGNDDYGSSESGADQRRSNMDDASMGGGNDGRNNGSNDSEFRRIRHRLYCNERSDDEGEQDSSDNDSIVSEDSYGASEDERPVVDARAIVGREAGSSAGKTAGKIEPSSGADDAPIGRLTRDPVGTLKRLQRSETLSARQSGQIRNRSKLERAYAQARSQPQQEQQSHQMLDPRDLANRLFDVQRSRSVGHSNGYTPITAHSSSTSRRQDEQQQHDAPRTTHTSGKANEEAVHVVQQPNRLRAQNTEIKPNLNKPLPTLEILQSSETGFETASSDTAATMITASEMHSSSRRPSTDHAQASIVSGFAHTVRMRSQSRSRMRPTAMMFSSSAPVPAVPAIVAPGDGAQAQGMSAQSRSHASTLPSASPATDEAAAVAWHSPLSKVTHEPEKQQDGVDELTRTPSSSLATSRVQHRTTGSRFIVDGDTYNSNSAFDEKTAKPVEQHRVYLLNRQRSTHVGVSSTACARDLVIAVLRTDAMPVDERVGGWALFDVTTMLGVERPVREYERIADVLAARTSLRLMSSSSSSSSTSPRVNQHGYFVIKRTDLSPYLSAHALPTASPALAGWVYVQDNSAHNSGSSGRKWSKRWLELRDSALYLAKSEKGRDEVVLCHLSVFDVFVAASGEDEASWASRAPKKNTFAVCLATSVVGQASSTRASFYFCLTDPRAARHWITAISRARSYVLRLEDPSLLAAKLTRDGERNSATPAAISDTAAAHSGDGAPTQQQQHTAATRPIVMPQRPLVQLNREHFEKGSLLESARNQQQDDAPSLATLPPPRGSSAVHRKPAPALGGHAGTAADEGQQHRHDEVRQAERQGRMEGRPLIGLVADLSMHTSGPAGTRLHETSGSQ